MLSMLALVSLPPILCPLPSPNMSVIHGSDEREKANCVSAIGLRDEQDHGFRKKAATAFRLTHAVAYRLAGTGYQDNRRRKCLL